MIKYRPCPTFNVYIPAYKNVFKCILHKSIFKDLKVQGGYQNPAGFAGETAVS